MCCYWNHLYCTTLSETLLSCQRIGHFLLQQMMLCELCAATGTIIYCTSLPQTLEFLRDLDTFCSRWCYVSCMCCCYWNKNLLHNISTTLWGSQIGHFCSKGVCVTFSQIFFSLFYWKFWTRFLFIFPTTQNIRNIYTLKLTRVPITLRVWI
jgi:hypothetical protein